MNRCIAPTLALALVAILAADSAADPAAVASARFEVSFSRQARTTAVDGRVYVSCRAIPRRSRASRSTRGSTRSRSSVSTSSSWLPVRPPSWTAPPSDIPPGANDIPAGEYHVQALLNVYERFKRSDGHTLLLPPDRGEGQQWHEKPGNLLTRPQKLRLDPDRKQTLRLSLDQVLPPIQPPRETRT